MTSYKAQGVTAGAITSYTYDSLGRLKTAIEKSGTTTTASWAYAYDADGNRTSEVRSGSTGATAGTITYNYNAGDEITSTSADTTSWAYDANGDQTTNGITGQTQTINDRDAVTAIGSETLTDFAQGNTTQLSRSTPSSTYTSSALGLGTETQGSATTAYTHAPSGDLISERTTGGTYYYVKDSTGSVIGLFSSDRQLRRGLLLLALWRSSLDFNRCGRRGQPAPLHRRVLRHRVGPVQARSSLLRPHSRSLHPGGPVR